MNDDTFIEKTLDLSKKIDIGFVKKFVVFDKLSSTNTKAKELARNGEEEGTVVIARMQQNGRGRFDRRHRVDRQPKEFACEFETFLHTDNEIGGECNRETRRQRPTTFRFQECQAQRVDRSQEGSGT